MSGFVDSLLARSRGTADVIRPRLASLFEPDAPPADRLDGQVPADVDGEVAGTFPRAGDVPAGGFASPRHAGAVSPVAASSQASSREAGASAHVAPPIPEAGDVRPARRSAVSERSHRNGDVGPNRKTKYVEPAGHPPARSDERHTDPDPRSSLWPLATATRQRIARASSSSSGASATTADRRAARRAADIDRPGADAMEARLVAPAVATPALAPPAGSRVHFEPVAARRRTAAPDPIVEVSIGRIEVRAAVERGSDRPARQSSAVMGLDEYLRTRARGGSR